MLRHFAITALVGSLMAAFVLALQSLKPADGPQTQMDPAATQGNVLAAEARQPAGTAAGAATGTNISTGRMLRQPNSAANTMPQQRLNLAGNQRTGQSQRGMYGGFYSQMGAVRGNYPMSSQQPAQMPMRMGMGMGMGMCGRMMSMMMGGMNGMGSGAGQMSQPRSGLPQYGPQQGRYAPQPNAGGVAPRGQAR